MTASTSRLFGMVRRSYFGRLDVYFVIVIGLVRASCHFRLDGSLRAQLNIWNGASFPYDLSDASSIGEDVSAVFRCSLFQS